MHPAYFLGIFISIILGNLVPILTFDTPQRAERLEMAHFASEEQAQRFETEFRSYLVPGLIDGPELAEEVSKLEGMAGEWIEVSDKQPLLSYADAETLPAPDSSFDL